MPYHLPRSRYSYDGCSENGGAKENDGFENLPICENCRARSIRYEHQVTDLQTGISYTVGRECIKKILPLCGDEAEANEQRLKREAAMKAGSDKARAAFLAGLTIEWRVSPKGVPHGNVWGKPPRARKAQRLDRHYMIVRLRKGGFKWKDNSEPERWSAVSGTSVESVQADALEDARATL